MGGMKNRIEKRTGVLWGTFQVSAEPWASSLWIRVGGRAAGYVTLEIGAWGRAFYLTTEPTP